MHADEDGVRAGVGAGALEGGGGLGGEFCGTDERDVRSVYCVPVRLVESVGRLGVVVNGVGKTYRLALPP